MKSAELQDSVGRIPPSPPATRDRPRWLGLWSSRSSGNALTPVAAARTASTAVPQSGGSANRRRSSFRRRTSATTSGCSQTRCSASGAEMSISFDSRKVSRQFVTCSAAQPAALASSPAAAWRAYATDAMASSACAGMASSSDWSPGMSATHCSKRLAGSSAATTPVFAPSQARSSVRRTRPWSSRPEACTNAAYAGYSRSAQAAAKAACVRCGSSFSSTFRAES